jgi:hypothetical protein
VSSEAFSDSRRCSASRARTSVLSTAELRRRQLRAEQRRCCPPVGPACRSSSLELLALILVPLAGGLFLSSQHKDDPGWEHSTFVVDATFCCRAFGRWASRKQLLVKDARLGGVASLASCVEIAALVDKTTKSLRSFPLAERKWQ